MQPTTPSKRRVLVVDNDPDLLATIKQGLQLLGGYDVEVASEGIAGLEAFFAMPVDCMVVDLSMPGLNGYQLIRALRGDAATAQIPIVELSALAQEQVEIIGLLSGADAYLYKPVDLQTLIDTVERTLALTAEQRLEHEQALAESFSLLRNRETHGGALIPLPSLACLSSHQSHKDTHASPQQVSFLDTPRSLRRGILRSSSPNASCPCEHSASWRSVPKRFVPAKRNPFPPARRYGERLRPPGQQPEY
jgi:CheY-like chemotaxis protein